MKSVSVQFRRYLHPVRTGHCTYISFEMAHALRWRGCSETAVFPSLTDLDGSLLLR